MIIEEAPAKVNLTLEVIGRRGDGYHLLESLVVFPDIGDRLRFESSGDLRLELEGPEAGHLVGTDNIVMGAARMLQKSARTTKGALITLEKNLPVASGIGGGSADAAAALRGLCRLWSIDPGSVPLGAMALQLGADVPVCLNSQSAMMCGIGERVTPALDLPKFSMVLVNCRKPVSTATVFQALDAPCALSTDDIAAKVPAGLDFSGLMRWVRARGNHLQEPALATEPEIQICLTALEGCQGVALSAMSGSGATCFALFEGADEAHDAASALAAEFPQWWIEPACVR